MTRCAILIVGVLTNATPAQPRLDVNGDALPDGANARLGSVRFRHPGLDGSDARRAAISANGQFIVTASVRGIRCWNSDGRMRWEFSPEAGGLLGVRLSANGERVVVRQEKNLIVLDGATGAKLQSVAIPPAPDTSQCMAVSPNGKTAALMTYRDGVMCFDLENGRPYAPTENISDPNGWIMAVTDDRRLVMTNRGEIWQRDISQQHWSAKTELKGLGTWYDFSPDGRTLAISDNGAKISQRFVDANTGQVAFTFRDDGRPLESTPGSFSPDGKKWLCVSRAANGVGTIVHFIDLEKRREVHRTTLPDQAWAVVATDSNAKSIVTTLPDAGAWIWDAVTGKAALLPPSHLDSLTAVMVTPDGNACITGGRDGALNVWDSTTGKHLRALRGHPGGVLAVTFGDRNLISSGVDGAIQIQNWQTGELVRTINARMLPGIAVAESFQPQQLALSADGRQLAALCSARNRNSVVAGHRIGVWDLAAGQLVAHHALSKSLWYMRFAPDGRLFGWRTDRDDASQFAPLRSGIIEAVWIDPTTGAETIRLPMAAEPASTPAFSSDGQRLLFAVRSSQRPTTLSLMEARSGVPRLEMPLDTTTDRTLRDCAIAPNERIALLRFTDHTAHFRDLTTGERLAELPRISADPVCAAFHPDGRSVVVGYSDGAALVWDMRRFKPTPPASASPDVEALWNALGDADGSKVHRAIWALIDANEPALTLLSARLKPADSLTQERAKQLIDDLGATRFSLRTAATMRLQGYDEQAIPALRRALDGSLAPEQRRRAEKLLAVIPVEFPAETIRALRAIEVLEHIGSPLAKKILEKIATGPPDAKLTKDARAALGRMVK